MSRIEEVLEQPDWRLAVEVDPNTGGDGPRVRVTGDPRAFRNFADILLAMAETVEHQPDRLRGADGWFLMFGGEQPQFQITGASFLSLCCDRTAPQ